jgi:hypothetical protein
MLSNYPLYGAHIFRRILGATERLFNAHVRAIGAGNPTRMDNQTVLHFVHDICFCEKEEYDLKQYVDNILGAGASQICPLCNCNWTYGHPTNCKTT